MLVKILIDALQRTGKKMNNVDHLRKSPIAKAISLLSGEQESKFHYEPALRMFQFKNWLIDDRKMEISFQRSAFLFLSLVISTESKSAKSRTPAKRIVETLMDEDVQRLVKEVLSRRFPTIYALSLGGSLRGLKARSSNAKDDIKLLNLFTGTRIRLALTNRKTAGLNRAYEINPTHPTPPPSGYSRSSFKRLRSTYRKKEAFLWVASQSAPYLLNSSFDTYAAVASCEADACKKDEFKVFCARTKWVMASLDYVSSKDQLGEVWSELAPISVDGIKRIPKEMLDSVLPVRRSATETKKGKRQIAM
jgi:hypothetical protein